MNSENKSLDVFGVKPIGEAFSTVTKGGVEGAGAFLSRICLPAAEEFGLLLQDKVRGWRGNNVAKIVEEAEKLIGSRASEDLNGHPRIVHKILENGSWSDDDVVRKMWAGLLASSCTKDGKNDENIVFVNILNQLTSAQVKITNFACIKANKYLSEVGLLYAEEFTIDQKIMLAVAEINDVNRLDRELDCLRILELIGAGAFAGSGGGLDPITGMVNLCPSCVAMQLFVKSQGFMGTPAEFWGLKIRPMQVGTKVGTIIGSTQTPGA